jgi:2-polyprenyl-6-methoxyphenol hydroxylase-like FAD-dependent oxidoreductase
MTTEDRERTGGRASSPPRAAVIGGSIAGLFAAVLLRRRGWDVSVHERNASELAGRGAGIVTHPPLDDALRLAGIDSTADLGVPIPMRRTFGRDGSVIGALAFPQVNTSWDRLFQLLRARMPDGTYHLGQALTAIDQTDDGVVATFSDGTWRDVDLVVAADGIRSSVRGLLMPDVQPQYAGYIAWRGLVEESALSDAARDALFGGFGFCLPPGEQILGYPVAGAGNAMSPGSRRYNFVWYRPAAEGGALDRLLTDDAGRHHPQGIPPPLIARAVVAEMLEAAERGLAACFAEAVRKTAMPFFQPIFDLAVPRMAIGRVAIIGDAAFVARPHVGAGVTKAAEDAVALAEAVSHGAPVPQALARFEAERLPIGHRIIARARHLGAYMQAQQRTPEEKAAAERFRTPDAVMRETASLAFLAAAE